MKTTKAIRKALAFLIDNFLIYLVTSLLLTFFNPYAHSFENKRIFVFIYIATLIIYISFAEAKYKTTLGEKILKVKK